MEFEGCVTSANISIPQAKARKTLWHAGAVMRASGSTGREVPVLLASAVWYLKQK